MTASELRKEANHRNLKVAATSMLYALCSMLEPLAPSGTKSYPPSGLEAPTGRKPACKPSGLEAGTESSNPVFTD
jgi:hypothetical protein